MSLINRLLGIEERSTVQTAHPRDPVIAEWFGGSTTSAGIRVTPETARSLSAIYACVRILSTALAMLPLLPYRNLPEGGREVAKNHRLHNLLRWQPNPWQTAFEWKEMMQGHLLLRGKGFNYIEYGNDGQVKRLIPLHPDRTRAFWVDDESIAFEHYDRHGNQHIYLQDEILYLRGMGGDIINPLSPIDELKETIGLSLAAEQFGATFFGSGTVASGVLQTDEALSDKAFARLQEEQKKRSIGLSNAHKPMILEEGLKWQALGVEPEKAQFLETRKFQVAEICRIFGVPPHMVADVEKSTSWGSGIESQGIGFVIYSLQPWLTRWEEVLKRDLLTTNASKNLYFDFNVKVLLRGDSKARGEYYKMMQGVGAINADEIREEEGYNPLPDGQGKKYYVPLNMVSTDAIPEQDPPTDPEGDQNGNDTLRSFHLAQLRHAIDKINTCECKAIERALKACPEDVKQLEERITAFYVDHNDFMRRHLEPVARNKTALIITALRDLTLGELATIFNSYSPIKLLNDLLEEWRADRTDRLTNSLAAVALEGICNER